MNVTSGTRIRIATWCLFFLPIVGCGGTSSSTTPVAVSGTVTVAGKLLPHGVVDFQLIENESINRVAIITDGKFALDDNGGLVEGDYVIRILPYEPEVEELAQIGPDKLRAINAARKLIPEKYQRAGELNSTLSADKENIMNFDLKS